MKIARWLLPIVSLALVLWLTWWNVGGARMGPGPLHPVHSRLAEIEGGARCEACHRAGQGIDPAHCGKCHAPIAAQVAGGTGLHGNMTAAQRGRCELCHPEHHGDTAPLIAGHAFAAAGIPDPSRYDHAHVDFRLRGAHAAVRCTKCHIGSDAVEPPTGGRFLGITQACQECHDDAHRGAFGGNCESCHGQERPWRESPGFRHEALALRDAHRRVACAECHPPGSARDVAALQERPQAVRGCADCHADPHGPTAPKALQLERTVDCARCHAATQWATARPTVEQHASFGLPLRGNHAAAACASCHGDAQQAPRWTGQAPAIESCAACHQHPHADAVIALAGEGAHGCAGCHADADASFAAGRIDSGQHATIGFALAGPHADVACASCHGGSTWQQRFPGRRPEDCRACHEDPHGGQFAAEPRFAQCTACHLETSFRPVQFGTAAHARTAFPLTGAHDAVGCASCHHEVVAGVRRFHGTSRRCSGCHTDVHAGRFDRAGRPDVVEGRTDCARCHDTKSFSPVAAAFDHASWTGHELAGAHARVDCAKCHPRAALPGAASMQLGKAAGTTCAACHTDPHAGQFAEAGATDCRRCHQETTFAPSTFDHAKSRFPLEGVHAGLACGKCHLSYESAAGAVVRYRPLGTTCGDCHRLGAGGNR